MKLQHLIFILGTLLASSIHAEEIDSSDVVPAEVSGAIDDSTAGEPTPVTSRAQDVLKTDDNAISDLINVGLRIDPGLIIGSPIQQGFVINSVRLTLFGTSDRFDYRLSLGQTREFAAALIPQMTAVEAYVRGNAFKEPGEFDEYRLQAKIGMFTPSFHPYWSPDLSDVDINDYSLAHRDVLIGRDLGAELKYQNKEVGFSGGFGAFNGSGITTINSNNTKAFTVFLRQQMGTSQSNVAIGLSGYWLGQSTRGGVNFKSNALGMGYTELSLFDSRLKVVIEYFGGTFEDSTRRMTVSGGALWGWFQLFEGARLFARIETLSGSPVGNSLGFDHLVMGPIFDLNRSLKLFTHFETVKYEDGNTENQMIFRLRLNL